MRAILLTALLAVPAAAQEKPNHAPGARDRASVLMPDEPRSRAFHEEYGFADAVVIDGTAYLSGVVVGPGPGGDLTAGFDRAFRRLGEILKRAGGSWRDVVDMTSYHTDVTGQLKPMNEAKARYITAPFPTWTAIQVVRLVPDGGIAEIKLVARIAPRAAAKR